MCVCVCVCVCVCMKVCLLCIAISHLRERGLSENMKRFGGRAEGLAAAKVGGLLSENMGQKYNKKPFYRLLHLCGHMHKISAVITNKAVGDQRRMWVSLRSAVCVKTFSCCMNSRVIPKLGCLGGNTCKERLIST